jgi:hypothetical protein
MAEMLQSVYLMEKFAVSIFNGEFFSQYISWRNMLQSVHVYLNAAKDWIRNAMLNILIQTSVH